MMKDVGRIVNGFGGIARDIGVTVTVRGFRLVMCRLRVCFVCRM